MDVYFIMIHLICQDWLNTSGNHAGIMYLCKTLQNRYPDIYSVYCAPQFLPSIEKRHVSRLGRKWDLFLSRLKHKMCMYKFYKEIFRNSTNGDVVIFMEYMEEMYPVLSIAQKIKRNIPYVKTYAMVHLVPSKLTASYSDNKKFMNWSNSVDYIITLGSSLTQYFIDRGVEYSKIITTFHYVDDYYMQPIDDHNEKAVKVIAMGSQMRNVKLLSTICKDNPDVNFTICQGLSDMSKFFSGLKNVTLVPFVSENELRNMMKDSDISLNSMEDTIGSNVIVTSLAMGLAMVCSDVGSIRDYCDDSNTIFCRNESINEFSYAIKKLTYNRELLLCMRKSAAKRACDLSIDKFHRQVLSWITK